MMHFSKSLEPLSESAPHMDVHLATALQRHLGRKIPDTRQTSDCPRNLSLPLPPSRLPPYVPLPPLRPSAPPFHSLTPSSNSSHVLDHVCIRVSVLVRVSVSVLVHLRVCPCQPEFPFEDSKPFSPSTETQSSESTISVYHRGILLPVEPAGLFLGPARF